MGEQAHIELRDPGHLDEFDREPCPQEADDAEEMDGYAGDGAHGEVAEEHDFGQLLVGVGGSLELILVLFERRDHGDGRSEDVGIDGEEGGALAHPIPDKDRGEHQHGRVGEGG